MFFSISKRLQCLLPCSAKKRILKKDTRTPQANKNKGVKAMKIRFKCILTVTNYLGVLAEQN